MVSKILEWSASSFYQNNTISSMDFKLQFQPTKIRQYAAKFTYPKDESEIAESINQNAKDRGYLTMGELQTVCLWKSARSKSRVASNLSEDVEAISKVFLETTNERLRICSLLYIPFGLTPSFRFYLTLSFRTFAPQNVHNIPVV